MNVAILCIGNVLMMDEGVGPDVARYIESRYELPEGVEVLDRACMGMSIISDLRAYDFALVLDAVEVPDARPGQVFSFAPDDVAPTPAGMTSLHDVRFADVLASAELLGIHCAGHCFGIQVENMSPSEFVMALTPRVAAALPLLAQAAVRYLRDELGFEVCDRLAAREIARDGLVLPAVYGEPDATVMTRYLAAGLAAVGAGGTVLDDGAGGCGRVEVVLPQGACDGVAAAGACLGLDDTAVRALAETGCCAVRVTPETTDVDCDRFIGVCQDACRA